MIITCRSVLYTASHCNDLHPLWTKEQHTFQIRVIKIQRPALTIHSIEYLGRIFLNIRWKCKIYACLSMRVISSMRCR